ncbi:uncharacterized protein LOC110458140 isoform X2 [Mizuhopecten yessoensis]|uniref:uncharacterized protein LOC110458140 isoform X2 n=1 Tax=Mizuhopecten yessoensis TaxID=6573 RepID=UPI000B457F2E|nr:uncharacterized protein LOC110458140 isoform X2 [Mizuhopecten yessoensis]
MNGIAVFCFGYIFAVTCLLGTSQASLRASHTTSFKESQDCLQNSHYRYLKSLVGNSCSPMDDQWYHLHHLTFYQSLAHCARDAAKYIRDYYQHHHARSDCSCSVGNTSLTHLSHSQTLDHCRNSDRNYRDIFDTTFYDSHSTSHERICHRHFDEMGKLAAVAENSCFMDLVAHFDRQFFHSHGSLRRCSCQITNGGNGGATHTPQHHTSTDQCMQYSQYQYLDTLLAHDTCISHYKVWSYLDPLTSLSPTCRVKIIERLNAAYGHFSHTPSNCTCSTNFDPLHLYNDPHGHYQQCRNANHYQALTSRLLHNQVSQVCSSHHTVWKELSQIPHNNGYNYYYCQKDAISHIADSVSRVHNPCVCVPANVVTSTSTTTSPPITDFKLCNTIALTIGLAYGEVLKEGNFTCSDGSHALSEATPMKLCNATDSSKWIKGQHVISHCDSIPMFSAIASFAGQVYTHDGLAGVFLGCNSTHISIASEDCTQGLTRFYIPRDGRDSYIHSAINYFTISW